MIFNNYAKCETCENFEPFENICKETNHVVEKNHFCSYHQKWETFPEKIAADILKEVKKSIFTTDKDSRAIQESIMKVLKESNIERG